MIEDRDILFIFKQFQLSQDRILNFSKAKNSIQCIIGFGYMILELKVTGQYIYYVRKNFFCELIKMLAVPAPLKVALELQPHPLKQPKVGAFK